MSINAWEKRLVGRVLGCVAPDNSPLWDEVGYTDGVLESLSPREEKVIRLRYESGLTLQRSASHVPSTRSAGRYVTRERVRQIEAKALRKLRHPSRLKAWGFRKDNPYLPVYFRERIEAAEATREASESSAGGFIDVASL